MLPDGGGGNDPLVGAPRKHSGRRRRAKKPGRLAPPGSPDVLTGPVHPFGSLAALTAPPSERTRAHSFASPPHGGFAFVGEAPGSDFLVGPRPVSTRPGSFPQRGVAFPVAARHPIPRI